MLYDIFLSICIVVLAMQYIQIILLYFTMEFETKKEVLLSMIPFYWLYSFIKYMICNVSKIWKILN